MTVNGKNSKSNPRLQVTKEIIKIIDSDTVDYKELGRYGLEKVRYACGQIKEAIVKKYGNPSDMPSEVLDLLRKTGKALANFIAMENGTAEVLEKRRAIRNFLRSGSVNPKNLVDIYDHYQIVLSEYERVDLGKDASSMREKIRPRLYADCDRLDRKVLDVLKTMSQELQSDSMPLSDYKSQTSAPEELAPKKPSVPEEIAPKPVAVVGKPEEKWQETARPITRNPILEKIDADLEELERSMKDSGY